MSRNDLSNANKSIQNSDYSELVILNVGGSKFVTTSQTLLSINDTFFTALLSGGLPSFKDESGAIFIDRDPELFVIILNYLRTHQLSKINEDNACSLRHEAEFYGISPMVKQLKLYENLVSSPTCGGDILFQSILKINQPKAATEFTKQVKQIVSFDNGLVIVYSHFVNCYRLSDNYGWQCVFESGFIENEISLVDFHYEFSANDLRVMLAICEKEIGLWSARCFPYLSNGQPHSNSIYRPRNNSNNYEIQEIGRFHLKNYPVDSMFFIGSQLVALSHKKGRVGIWNSSRRWFVQDLNQNNNQVSVITAFDKAESDYLFLCSNHGTIYLIDMQKFPLRMKDGDLLINEFYKDPENEEILAISCFLCSPVISGKSIEIAYGTKSGTVRILVHHPETVGQGPQLFQTIKVHLSAISKIMLSNEYLITMCDKLHVRTWSLARFRGLISTQPGTKSHASFKIYVFDDNDNAHSKQETPMMAQYLTSNSNNCQSSHTIDVGPYGDQKGESKKQVFVEMPSKSAKHINILYAANGQKICTLRSVDGSLITSVCMYQHDARSRQFIVTGHSNGHVQIWDLTTAMELVPKIDCLASRQIVKKELIKEIFCSD